jgi:hypothetical protein
MSHACSSLTPDRKNKQNLDLIENALLVVCIDEPLPASFNCRTLRSDVPEAVRGHIVDSRDETNMAHQMIHGGGSAANSVNRWFDMTVQVRESLNLKMIIPIECYCTRPVVLGFSKIITCANLLWSWNGKSIFKCW